MRASLSRGALLWRGRQIPHQDSLRIPLIVSTCADGEMIEAFAIRALSAGVVPELPATSANEKLVPLFISQPYQSRLRTSPPGRARWGRVSVRDSGQPVSS